MFSTPPWRGNLITHCDTSWFPTPLTPCLRGELVTHCRPRPLEGRPRQPCSPHKGGVHSTRDGLAPLSRGVGTSHPTASLLLEGGGECTEIRDKSRICSHTLLDWHFVALALLRHFDSQSIASKSCLCFSFVQISRHLLLSTRMRVPRMSSSHNLNIQRGHPPPVGLLLLLFFLQLLPST